MGQTAVKLTSIFGNAVRPKAGPKAAASQTRKIDNYELTKCLGSGGMGTVYKARDEKLDRVVALKVMQKDLRSDPALYEAFNREARAVAKLNHPNIAQIYSFGESDGKPFIVMEFVAGEHFDNLVFSPAKLDQAKVMKVGMEIAQGLQVAADAGLVHGDIKPENIVFDDHGVPKLLDFGIASASNAKSTEIWGTPYYIAPEKLKKQRVDFRSDIYCLGGTLYHALTKHPPFDGDDVRTVLKARLTDPPAPMSVYRDDIDPEVEAIISRMLQIEPADRYPTYGALIADIRKYLRRVDPKSVHGAGLFEDEGGVRQRRPQVSFFRDVKSQIMLLLVLVALFPYFVFFYAKPMLFRSAPPPVRVPVVQHVVMTNSASEIAATELLGTGNVNNTVVSPVTNEAEIVDIPDDDDGAVEEITEVTIEPVPEISEKAPEVVTLSQEQKKSDIAEKAIGIAPESVKPKPVPPAVERSQSSVKEEIIDLTDDAPVRSDVKWPSLKVTAIIGDGEGGSALVNGEILTVGYRLDNGVKLKAVEPQSAIFEFSGVTKRVFVSKPASKQGAKRK